MCPGVGRSASSAGLFPATSDAFAQVARRCRERETMLARTYQVLITTSLRSGRRVDGQGEEVSGSLLLGTVDTEALSFSLIKQVEVPQSPHRRGRNSVRGVARFADGFAVCNTTQLFLFDRKLERITGSYSEKRFGDIHSLAVRDGILYVTATASDSIIGLDRDLNRVFEWWAGSEPELARYMTEHPRQATLGDHDFRNKGGGVWNRFHINHVCFDGDGAPGGDMIVNLPNIAMGEGVTKLWNVTRKRFHLSGSCRLNPIDGRIHDGIILDGYHYLGRTEDARFVKLCKKSGRLEQSVDCRVPLGETTGNPIAIRHGWLRGAAHLDDERFLVGQSKLTLFLVDMQHGTRSPPLEMRGLAAPSDHPGLAIYCIEKLAEPVPA